MYICEACKKRPATVHLTNIENNNIKKQVHLCESCAQKSSISLKLQLPQVVASITHTAKSLATADDEPELRCPDCGITWQEFRDSGRFGCPEDAVVFRQRLQELLSEIHAHEFRHRGKVPARQASPAARARLRLRRELSACEQKLLQAAAAEEYEEAAGLRDRIRELRLQLGEENA